MEGGKGRVCVTGGTGFIASWLIMRLLQQGYSVNITVRDVKKDLTFLTSLPGARENLKIFAADLNDPESFDPAIQGCIGVFHLAAPIDLEGKEPEVVLTKRSIHATLGILKACLRSNTLKRVVYTSTTSAVTHDNNYEVEIRDDSFWTDVDFLRATRLFGSPYFISKTLTEKAALEFAAQHGLDLVTVLPSYVLGPFICPQVPGSVSVVLGMILGTWDERYFPYKIPVVHVDDVASAHIFLLEHPDANGRYICSTDKITIKEVVELLASEYPEHPINPMPDTKEMEIAKIHNVSSKKLLDTGFKYEHGINDMFDDAIKCCKEKGFL